MNALDTSKFTECGGDLFRNGHWDAPLRRNYSNHARNIETGAELRAALRAGPYAWPGGYSLAFIAADGEYICFGCARSELRIITQAIRDNVRGDGWRIVGITGEHESDSGAQCAHCNADIWEGAEDEA